MSADVPKINLDGPGVLKLLAKRLESDLDAFVTQESIDEGPRKYLGASSIGDACSRKLWYNFRWVQFEKHEPRMLRLFRRGHFEEPEQIKRLRGAGLQVWEVDANGKQFRFSAIHGHVGGGCDGFAKFPPSYNIETPFLLEFKTKGTGAGFNNLASKGVALTAPVYWAQECLYGVGFNVDYSIFISTNKNDDTRYLEIAKLDKNLGQQMLMKAERIIVSQLPMNKLSSDPTHFECRYCHYNKICHFDAPYQKNCRSCKNAMPVHNGNWECQLYTSIIPGDVIPKGCDRWEPAK